MTAEYLEEKKQEINTKKTEVMIFCHRQSTGNKDEESFNLNGEAVKVVSQAIYLGFHLTSNEKMEQSYFEDGKSRKSSNGNAVQEQ